MPKVSVIIPTYNNAEFLKEAIDSALSQTYKDIEIIVVDDGSTDNTQELMKDYVGKVTYIRQENSGPAKARNVGILHAKGDCIAFLDADDIWLPYKIEEQLKILQDNPNVALIHSKALFFDSLTGEEQGIFPKMLYSGHAFDALLKENGPIILSSVIIRSLILKKVGLFDESLFVGEDINLWLRVAKRHEIAAIDKVLLKERLHRKNISFMSNFTTAILDCLDKIIILFPETNPKRYPAMKMAYKLHGARIVKSLICYEKYTRCHSVCNKLLNISFLQPIILFYWIVTMLPPPLLNFVRKIKNMACRKKLDFIVCLLLILYGLFIDCKLGQSAEHFTKNIEYIKIFEKNLEGEAGMTVSAFDLRGNNSKNGIAVCGKKLYVLTSRGTLLYNSDFDIFPEGAQRIRIGKFAKDGYYNNIIIGDGKSVKVFDKFGVFLSSLESASFFNKDLNEDGIDELILNGAAFCSKDEGESWALFWQNRDINYMQDMVDSENGGGFCYNQYLGPVFAVDRYGNILFQSKPGERIRCLTSGDFDGDGVKDNIATSSADGTTYIYDKAGNIIQKILMEIDGEIIDLNEVTTIEAGQLNPNDIKDEIVVGGRRGLVACDSKGDILWSYIKWPGWNSNPCIYDLFIADLDNDGNVEVVAGKGDKILIFSNKGELLDELTVDGDLSKWKYPNSTMDIADIDNNCYQEILAVTSEGNFYVFGLKK